MSEFKFRYIESVHEFGVDLELVKFKLIKKTPRGSWVQQVIGTAWDGSDVLSIRKRFVLDGEEGKRLCYATLEAALKSYKTRKRHQISRAKTSLELAEFMLKECEKLTEPPPVDVTFGDEESDVLSNYVFY